MYKQLILLFIIIFNVNNVAANIMPTTTEFGYGNDAELITIARAKNNFLINKTLNIRDYTALSNYHDIQLLLHVVSNNNYRLQKALKLIDNDQKLLLLASKLVADNKQYSFITRNMLRLMQQRNYLLRAKELIKNKHQNFAKGIIKQVPQYEEVTILKMALWYLVISDDKISKEDLIAKLKMSYPLEIADESLAEKVDNVTLFQNSALYFPHAGYVLAADPINGDFRGTDCSGLIALVLNLDNHLGTYDYAKIWLYLSENYQVREELQQAAKSFKIVTKSELQVGDLVTWRWPKKKHQLGHIVFFVQWSNKSKGEFIGLEAALLPKGTIEGIGARKFNIDRDDTDLYLLRPVL
ncbi:MAG: C40 family peptidase [Rickettsiaceae bacterium]|nr:C40 family peptidase [Rickettsiaceae bacterium]